MHERLLPAMDPGERNTSEDTRRLRREKAARRPWVGPDRMSQSEVSLRLAMYLAERRLVAADESIVVALTGYELTRSNSPRFQVKVFLGERGYVAEDDGGDWRGAYYRRASGRTTSRSPSPADSAAGPRIVLHNRHGEGDVTARLANGRRLIAEVSGGPLVETRSPAEHKLLRGAIGRALTTEWAEATDVLCAVVPRSERTRALIARWRAAPRVAAARLRLVTVDRTGDVSGLE